MAEQNFRRFSPAVTARSSVRSALRRATAGVELLEGRRLLATIEGNIWNDVDNDGTRDFFEDGLPGVTVYLDLNTNAQLDDGEPSTVTNARGNYRFTGLDVAPPIEDDPETVENEASPGGSTYYVRQLPTAEGVELPLAQTAPGITGSTNVESAFNIDIVYADATLSDEQKTLVETSIARWQQVIIGDLPDVGDIDDLQINVIGSAVDGPGGILAFAGPNNFRPTQDDGRQGLPFTGDITIDLADADGSRGFVDTVTHEIGHVLGIGTVWDQFLVNRGSPSVAYVGENGVEEYGRLFNGSFSGVPVQAQVEGHWDANALANELMNPFSAGGFELPPDAESLARLSRLTVGALEDMGYEVSYGGVDTYGPFNIGALPEDLTVELGFIPFAIGAFLEAEDTVVDNANFGLRPNTDPSPFFVTAGPVIQQVGQPVRLLAELDTLTDRKFSGDVDYRDSLIQINFYRESNGTPGLQTGEGGDALLAEDADRSDNFEVNADTTGLDLGEVIFYARGYDEGYATVDRAVIVTLVDGQAVPAQPSNIRAIGSDEDTILVNWIDNSEDENGFLLQFSPDAEFDRSANIRNVYLPAQEGTGAYAYEYTEPEGSLTTTYFRVRSFTTGGSSPFGGRTGARTLSRDEVLLDDESDGVEVDGDFQQVIDRQRAINLTYLSGTSGFVQLTPELTRDGEYFVFFRSPQIEDPAIVAVGIFDEEGTLLDEIEVDQAASAGGEVLVGRFNLAEGSFVRVEPRSGTARVDTVRFLPVGA